MNLLNHFALLRVKAVQPMGCYLQWGQPKDLFLPHREQTEELEEGSTVIVYIFLDDGGRPIASMRLDAFFDPDTSRLAPRQKVSLLIFGETDLGFQAIIDGRYVGVLYRNEVFEELEYGSQRLGVVKKVRPDGKVDLLLQPDSVGKRILDRLEEAGGFLKVTDKSDPAEIAELFGVSKKKYKIAVGGLYKQGLVDLESDGIGLRAWS